MNLGLLKDRRVQIGLILALVAIIAIVLYVSLSPREERKEQQKVGQNENIDQDKYPGMTEAEIKEIKGAPDEYTAKYKLDRGRILRNEAQEYRIRSHFPDSSYPITRQNDPVFNEFTPSQPLNMHPDQPNGPFLVQYLDKTSHEPNEPLIIHAFLINEEKQKIVTNDLEAVLTIGGARGKILGTISMKDDGGLGDTAGDLIYTAAFHLPAELQAPDVKPTNYIVIIKSGKLTGSNAFSVGYLNIVHTGNYTDRIESDAKGNSLVIEAEFNVKKAGYFHIQGSLYGLDGEAIGWAQNRVKLETGKQRVPLTFYGKLICDKGVDGPYVFQNFAYQNVALMPGVRSPMIAAGYKTAAYPAKTFTCASFDNPDYVQKAEQAERDAAAESNQPGAQ